MQKLYHTRINTYKDSCKTYALKRIGLSHLVTDDDYYTVQMMCEGDLFDRLKEPESGCILVWKYQPEKPYYIAQEITEAGIILSTTRTDYGHCGVYEGNDLISDCMWEQEWGSIIRMRKYSELSMPDFILKYKQINNVLGDDFFNSNCL